ncbi:GDSL-type esterase/lipase family protein [Virgibacillus litoralis]|uniref:Lysophospholipase L1-like esterase n=1 Tax=Virgibacillus litoralis TaxID=578221 RepID=A0ABS4HDG4_9BACI|nr:GDSL-type esterase/lipase family protein [Virgibacillus litoralis]MBP1948946.1 lysophospholipase L1-like esterase [Virgibacillus litoralis]
MKRRYIFIILGILLIGLAIIIFINQPEPNINKLTDNDSQEETQQETEPDKEKETEDDQPEEETKEPITKFREIISDALQGTIDFFTNKEAHVTAIGDSLTQGVGDDVVDGGYIGILDNTINKDNQLVTFENYGKRGNRSSQLLKRLEEPKIAQSVEEADIVLITIGANDIMQVVKENFSDLTIKDFSQERIAYKERLKNIFERIKELNSDADIYLLGFYNPFEKYFKDLEELGMIVENWNNTGKNVTEQYENATFIPTVDLFEDTDKDMIADDNFHPNHQGYQRIAKRVLEHITD